MKASPSATALAVLLRRSDLGNALRTLYTLFYGNRRKGKLVPMTMDGVEGYFVPAEVVEGMRRVLWKSQQHQYADRVNVGGRSFGALKPVQEEAVA